MEPGESNRTLSLCLISMRNTDRRCAIVFSYPRAFFFFPLLLSLSLSTGTFPRCARMCTCVYVCVHVWESRTINTHDRVRKSWPRFHARVRNRISGIKSRVGCRVLFYTRFPFSIFSLTKERGILLYLMTLSYSQLDRCGNNILICV